MDFFLSRAALVRIAPFALFMALLALRGAVLLAELVGTPQRGVQWLGAARRGGGRRRAWHRAPWQHHLGFVWCSDSKSG